MTELEQMEAITEARYQQQQQGFQRVLAEENRLRSELMRLDEHLRETRITSHDDTRIRAIGADVIWQAWAGRRKTELNMKLARVLAMKEHHLAQVRRAYGKLLVSRELIAQERDLLKRQKARTELDRAIDQSLLHRPGQ